MPAKSKAQQKAAGAALSAKRGETKVKDLQGAPGRSLVIAGDGQPAGVHAHGLLMGSAGKAERHGMTAIGKDKLASRRSGGGDRHGLGFGEFRRPGLRLHDRAALRFAWIDQMERVAFRHHMEIGFQRHGRR